MIYNNIFKGKKVLVTGSTGFKGSWLSTWLLRQGADVYGYALSVPTTPSMFESLKLGEKLHQHYGDIRNREEFDNYVQEVRPDFVFHLAAQAIVSTSYVEPYDTITTNVLGTTVVLEALRNITWDCVAVLITSDKAYDNVEWIWGYRESDALGGKDVYSGSKGAAELTIKCYYHSFLKHKDNLKIGVARAGNVIGGGDWSADRIVVDTIKAFSIGEPVEIRSPKATRPWQHVLEPLSGYLRLAQLLAQGDVKSGEAFNFGPRAEQLKTVKQLAEDLASWWGMEPSEAVKITGQVPFEEAKLLKLNCDKALAYLQWQSTLSYTQTVEMIVRWYAAFYNRLADMFVITNAQIERYEEEARTQGISWSR